MRFTVPDEVARRFEAAANACGIRIEEAAVEALTEWTDRHLAESSELPELSFIGIGAGRPDLAEHHDDVLDAFIGCAASGQHDPFDIGADRAAAHARRAPGT